MKELLQEVVVFLWHVIDAPETSPETRDTAAKLAEKVTDAINAEDTNSRSPKSTNK